MKKEVVEQKLSEVQGKFLAQRVRELQVMVWTLSTEKGLYLMCDLRGNNPFEVGLDGGIDWTKDFIGKKALEKVKEEGPARTMVGFTVENDAAHIPSRHFGGCGTAVMYDGEEVGRVTKYTYGFTAAKNIGYAIVRNGILKNGDVVTLNDNEAVITDKVFA